MSHSRPRAQPSPPASAIPVERVREERPSDETWRADALAKSRHSRLADHLLRPVEDRDVGRSAAVCAAVTRELLRDFAPALILLPAAQRRRAQALTAYALTLFDFAGQSGLEGERLSQINRWEYDLEEALVGRPVGQPVFVLLASEEERQAWRREGFDRLIQCARHRVAVARPRTVEAAAREARELGGALAEALLGRAAPPPLESFAAALLRVRALQNLGESLRRHQARLAVEELPEAWDAAGRPDRESLARLVREECRRIRPLLTAQGVGPAIPQPFRTAAGFLRRAALRLAGQIERRGAAIVETPPRLDLTARLGLLLGARWLG